MTEPRARFSWRRRLCSNCMRAKTHWLIAYGVYWNRRCWGCMSESERRAVSLTPQA